jgi:hypothetical protein
MVAEQTRPSFQPITQDIKIAITIVVMRLRTAPSEEPLIPARSLAPFERDDASAPAEFMSRSKYEIS